MLYRPNYCCHCGEKVIRARWTPLASRRFCEFCEIEQKQHDLLPRAAMMIAVLIGAAGLTAYVGGGGETTPSKNQSSPTARTHVPTSDPDKGFQDRAKTTSNSSEPNSVAQTPEASKLAASNPKQRQLLQNSSTEPVHYCGAITKKGTPCTRRVKVKGRCWQHAGQFAESESEK